jgi:hypothetical protein
MSSITLKGSTTQNADIRLSAISARYNLNIYNVLSECVREIGGSPKLVAMLEHLELGLIPVKTYEVNDVFFNEFRT